MLGRADSLDRYLYGRRASTLVLADLYFFWLAGMILLMVTTFRATRGVYLWSVASRYRAGLATGLLAIIVVLLALATPTANAKSTTEYDAESAAWKRRFAPAMQATSDLEASRELLVAVAELAEPNGAPIAVRSALSADSENLFDACLQELMGSDEPQVRRYIEREYRLAQEDAHDIVRDALVDVCVAHSRKRYEKLGAVLHTSAIRRATGDWRRRRHNRCAVDTELPSCAPTADEVFRFQQEERLVQAALCGEDRLSQDVIYLRVRDEKSFATIGRELQVSEEKARWTFNNAVQRIRIRVANVCGG